MMSRISIFFFFFNDTATTEIYTLSLHDALPIWNCPVGDLRRTLDQMRRAWVRLTQLRSWPARGWVRAVEITRSQRDRTAHPHYHCLLMVPPAYFQGDYLKQQEWAELWRQCLRIDYKPVMDIRTVKLDLVQSSQRVNASGPHVGGRGRDPQI